MTGARNILFFAGCVLALSAADKARAQLFRCEGEDGRASYVSSASQCSSAYEKLPSFDQKSAKKSAAAPPSSGSSAAASGKSSRGKFAKVSPRRQSELDKKRGDILLYELQSERRIESHLGGLLADAEGDESRRRLLEKRRAEHRRNIAAIRRELARLGHVAAE